MKIFATIILISVCGMALSQTTFKEIYGDLNRSDYGESIAQISNGDYIMCGVQVYQDTTTNGNYIGEGVVRRLDANGNELWILNYNDPNSTNQSLEFSDIINTTDNNLVITGLSDYGFQNNYCDYFLTKIDTSGNVMWSHNYGGINKQWAKKVIETADNGFLMIGFNEVDGSANSTSLYAIKTDSNGTLEWEYLHPNTSNNSIRHQAYSVIEDSQGNFLISGSINQILHNSTDFYIVKINNNGVFLWDQILDHSVGGQGRDIFIKNNGNILVCGWYAPNYCARPLIIELSSSGTFLNENEFNFDLTCEWAYSFCKDSNDNIIMLSFDAYNNYRVTKIDTSSTILWNHFINYAQATAAEGNHIIKTSDNGFICAGTSIQGEIKSVAFKVDENGTLSPINSFNPLNGFTIFPNPTSDILNISILNDFKLLSIQLIDLNGKLVKQFPTYEKQLDISNIPGGQYFLKIEFNNGFITEKVIIK